MALFIVFYSMGCIGAIVMMLRLNKKLKEIMAFSALAAFGLITWIFLILEHPIKPSNWIGWIIEKTGI
jgi:hypothetical protein